MGRPLFLSAEQRQRLETALYEEDSAVQRAAFTELQTPEELHAFASHYNWDDGIRDMRGVIENPLCDRGTALMIYWLTDGVFLLDRPQYGGEVWDLAMEIEKRFLSGFYLGRNFCFDPGGSGQPDGEAEARRVPKEMKMATPGEIVDASWEALGGAESSNS